MPPAEASSSTALPSGPDSVPHQQQQTLYQVLDVAKDASEADIKRAYRRLALRYHPDKNPSPEAQELFAAVQRAFDILSDPKKREVYDMYGEMGLQMMESTPWLTPDLLRSIGSLSMLLALGILLLITQLALVCVRVDGLITWNWHFVLIPIYLLLGTGLSSSFKSAIKPTKPASENDDVGAHDHDERAKSGPEAPRAVKLAGLLFLASLTSLVILIGATANGSVAAWSMAIPYAICELYAITPNVLGAIFLAIPVANPESANDDDDDERPMAMQPAPWPLRIRKLITSLLPAALRITQAALIISKLDGNLDASWTAVFIPTYLWPLSTVWSTIVAVLVMNGTLPVPTGSERPKRSTIISALIGSLVYYALVYTTIGLIIAKLETGSPTLAVAVVPIWIVLILLTCLFGCCIPCATSAGGLDMDEMAAAEAGNAGGAATATAAAGGEARLPVARQIEYKGSTESVVVASMAMGTRAVPAGGSTSASRERLTEQQS